MNVTTIGLDIAKSVFQIHGIYADGQVAIRKRLNRNQMKSFFEALPPCLIGIEACATAHYWARELSGLGHEVRLMPAHYVKPYVKRSKNDAADAEAICEAVERPNMRFVPVKAPETQALALMHRMRTQLVCQRTALLNGLRAGLAEFGIITTTGLGGANELLRIADARDERMPELIRNTYAMIAEAIRRVEQQISALDQEIQTNARVDDVCRRLCTILGIGPVTSTTIVALAGDVSRFSTGRDFAAWMGLTPRQNSSGGKARLGRITKAGDQTLRTLLVLGAFTIIRRARIDPAKASPWLLAILSRRPPLVAAVAWANKTARIIWAMLTRGGVYRVPSPAC